MNHRRNITALSQKTKLDLLAVTLQCLKNISRLKEKKFNMQVFNKLFCKNKKSNKCEGTIKLSFEMEESVYLLELLIKKEEKIVVYDLNELNCLFESKYKKAYTVAQFQIMSNVLMILDGVSTSNIHLFSGCEYKNGKIGFEKGTYFKLCSCLIESRRNIREKGRTKEKYRTLHSQKNTELLQNQNTQKIELKKETVQPKININNTDMAKKEETQFQDNKAPSDTGGISKEEFKKQIQARKSR